MFLRMASNQLTDGKKRMLMMVADALMVPFALWAAVVLRYGNLYQDVTPYWLLFPISALLCVTAFQYFGLYRAIVRYIGPSAMIPVVQGVTITAFGVLLVAFLAAPASFPRSAPMIFWFISLMLVGGSRFAVRSYFYGLFNNYLTRESVAIYGAGASGAQLAIALLNGNRYMPVAFFDDDEALRKSTIHGIQVYCGSWVSRVVEERGVQQILLAMPSASHADRKRVLTNLVDLSVHVRSVPDFHSIVSGEAEISEIREIEIEDLLGRDAVPPDPELLSACIRDKVVLVTGAGGSIGSELSHIICTQQPRRLILLDASECALYRIRRKIEDQMARASQTVDLVALLGNVRDGAYLLRILGQLGVQTVYHAAAFKHVSLVQQNMIEGLRNNVEGTKVLVDAAVATGVESFAFISTDKAVLPKSILGASKRLAELLIQATAQATNATRFCMVRFGNVLDSSGSVVPIFKEQIALGGPVTVTHKDASRYFMTITEAAELVVQAGAMSASQQAPNGQLYVLDMGDPVSIHNLAERMILLSGNGIDTGDGNGIEIVYTGLAAGEKLSEELVIGTDVTGTSHPKILRAQEEFLTMAELAPLLGSLEEACDRFDYAGIEAVLSAAIPGFEMIGLENDLLSDRLDPSLTATIIPLK